jgi:hypothetical protein
MEKSIYQEVIMRIFSALLIIIAYCIPSISTAADIDGQDGDARFPEAEIGFLLDDTDKENPERRFNTISIGYTGSNVEFDQYLTSGGYTHPEPLHNEIKLRVGYLRFIRHLYFRKNLEWNWGLGLGHATYQLTSSAAGKVSYLEDKAVGLHGQVGLTYHLTSMIAFEGNLAGYAFKSDNDSILFGPQLQFSFTPTDAVRLHAGFRNWIHYIDFNEQNLDVETNLSGLNAGLTLLF